MKEAMCPAGAQVLVHAPARLHMGFLDLSGGIGRRFGGLGVGLQKIGTRVIVRPAAEVRATGPDNERARRYAHELIRALRVPPVAVEVAESAPAHVGLGSGTQLALAVGVAIARLYRRPASARDIAALTERGARSGIGVGVFEQGGFVLDGGRGASNGIPPVIARAAFPETWRFILVFDRQAQGLHGRDEVAAFQRLPPFPAAVAAHLCRVALMQMLPALVERDLPTFGKAVTELQGTVGDYFAPAQGGRFASPWVARALAWLERAGAAGVGQSSWGPTGFALVDDPVRAAVLAVAAAREVDGGARLRFVVAKARNESATVLSSESGSEPHSASGTRQRAGAYR